MKIVAAVIALLGLASQVAVAQEYFVEDYFPRTTADRVREHGYPAEIHQAETEDNYVITMFRIPYSHKLQNQNQQRPAILLMHGLSSCSDAWILNGPNDALAYLLADAGYDVWMGNARGTRYSRSNTRLSTRHPHFYRFSWHEIGAYDLPAMIDYIIATTGETKVHYTGHSQGTTVFFTMAAFRPEYNEKIKTSHMLAPVAFMGNMTLALAKYTRRFISTPNLLTKVLDDTLWWPDSFFPAVGSAITAFCNKNELTEFMCYQLSRIDIDAGTSAGTMNQSISGEMSATHPAGMSTNQLIHYVQNYETGRFALYDWGAKENLKRYGQPTTPDYDVSQITSKLFFYYCTVDEFADVKDVEYLASILPEMPTMYHVPDPNFSHADFAWSMNVKEEINDRIIAACDAYENSISGVNYIFDNLNGMK